MKKVKIEEHECKDYVLTEWRWNVQKDDWEPTFDVCTNCGKIVYEY